MHDYWEEERERYRRRGEFWPKLRWRAFEAIFTAIGGVSGLVITIGLRTIELMVAICALRWLGMI